MKELLKKIGGMFLDKNGKVSYKRVTGYICLTTAIVIAAVIQDMALSVAFLTPATVSAGLVLAEKKDD